MSTIASLKIGETGVISDENQHAIPLKLLEMGCLPGAEVELIQIAPMKDPMYICVNGSHIAIRKETALKIKLTNLDCIDGER
ncbi:FeoA family protein [Tenacibaculum amylolyticum]|uniref:FeoA family protein n=1 Tax=Tenacibaculum amylolyticum TaxID=104269 RepID=UPI0038B4BAC9